MNSGLRQAERESCITDLTIQRTGDTVECVYKYKETVQPGFNITMCSKAQIHDMIKPLAWLLGKWKSEGGKGQYPTITPFHYAEEADFFHVGQPNVQFSFYSYNAENKKPLHRETGFIRIQPGTNKIAFICAHNFGVSEVQEGEVKGTSLTVETTGIHRMSFAKDPAVKKVVRTFQLVGDELEQVLSMETTNTPTTEHLRITYKKME